MSTNELEVGRVIPATPAGRIEHVQHLITGLYADVLAFRAAIENAMPFIEWSAEADCDCDTKVGMAPCMSCEAAHIEKTFKELLGCPEWIFSETVRYARAAKRKES